MPLRALFLIILLCTGCRSGIIPCPDPEVARLKKSSVNKRANARDLREPEVTALSQETPNRKAPRYRYVKYEIEHVDVEDLDCPRPGQKNVPKAVKNNIRKNRRNVRYYFEQPPVDSVAYSSSATTPRQ